MVPEPDTRHRGLPALAALALCCSGPETPDIDDGLSVTDGVREEPFEDTGVESLRFMGSAQRRLVTGSTERLQVEVSPAQRHVVRFSLLGDARGAFLLEGVVTTDDDGIAEAQLTVLEASVSFAVRAASGNVDQLLRVETLPASVGNLRVDPNYGGNRDVDTWVASVHLDASCADVTGPPFADGPLSASASAEPGTVRLNRVPANRALAVVVRAEQFAGGCRSLASLRAGADTFIDIDVFDRPMQIDGISLNFSFGLDASAEVTPALDDLVFRAVTPLTGGADDDLQALLDAMSSLAEDSAALEAARVARGWRAALIGALAPDLPGSGLRTLVRDWMQVGLARLTEPDGVQGVLTTLADDTAELELVSVLGLDPQAAGFRSSNAASVTAEADDFLRTGATLSWEPAKFLGVAAEMIAGEQLASALGVTGSAADGMALTFGCGEVGAVLAAAGETPGEAFVGCDESCVVSLCEAAMVELWSRVEGANLPVVPWDFSGAARAEIDADARPALVRGTWVGSLAVEGFGSGTTPIQGSFSATSRD